MHKCPKCGQEFDGNFCPVCGLQWKEEKTCPKCGAKLAGAVRFCNECGYSFLNMESNEKKPSAFKQKMLAVGGWFKNAWVCIKSHLKIVIPVTVVVIALIILISVLATVLPNKFRIGKVSKIGLGYTQQQVLNVLGEPYEGTKTDYKWEYYDDKSISLINKINKCKKEIANALLYNDSKKFEKYLEKQLQLEEQLQSMTYKYIEVNFTSNNDIYKVTSIYFDAKRSANLTETKKQVKKLEVPNVKFNGYIDNKISDNYVAVYGKPVNNVIYRAKFNDGSYYKSYIDDLKFEISGSAVKLKWSDELSEYECTKFANDIEVNIVGEIDKEGTWTTTDKTLTSLVFPESVTSISSNAFKDCNSLAYIVIPDSVMEIGSCSFQYCDRLTSINFKGTKEQWASIEKGDDWDEGTGDYTVHCTNGDIIKQQ